MTPELPRAPRSRAEAVTEAAWSTVAGSLLRSSVTAVPMVMDILVPVSPSGTGNTFRSLMACFWAVMAGGAVQHHLLKQRAGDLFVHLAWLLPYRVMESTHTSTVLDL